MQFTTLLLAFGIFNSFGFTAPTSLSPSLTSCETPATSHNITLQPVHIRSPASAPPFSIANWMSYLPDTAPLTSLSIPGTHNSMAYPRPRHHISRFSECQHHPLAAQLTLGIRFLDLRLRHHKNNLLAHHGPEYLHASLTDFLLTTTQFLRTHPTETLLVRVQAVKKKETSTRTFWETWTHHRDVDPITSPLFREFVYSADYTQFPRLGEARGKMVMIRDFPGPALSVGPWWGSRDVMLIQDDWEQVRTRPKLLGIQRFWLEQVPRLVCALDGRDNCYTDFEWGVSNRPKLLVSFLSAASWWRQPKSVAKRVWREVWGWLGIMAMADGTQGGPLGVIVGDYVTGATTRAIVRRNFMRGAPGAGVQAEWEDERWQRGWRQEYPVKLD